MKNIFTIYSIQFVIYMKLEGKKRNPYNSKIYNKAQFEMDAFCILLALRYLRISNWRIVIGICCWWGA